MLLLLRMKFQSNHMYIESTTGNMTPIAHTLHTIFRLVETLWWGHGSLDGQATNVLPALLQQGHEVVDSQHDVTDQLILSHADIADGDTHAENLLKLELDCGLDIGDLVGEILSVGDWGWEFASLGETGSEETRNLLDEGVGRDEGIVLACELLDQLLVLVTVRDMSAMYYNPRYMCLVRTAFSSRRSSWHRRRGA
jgi:hypothetical protein